METIGTTELRNLMNGYVAKARYCQANGMPDVAHEHAQRALAYAGELDRRNNAQPVTMATAA